MISKQTIVAGLAMLLLCLPLYGNITTHISGQTISVQSDQAGIAGLRGCDPATAQKTPAYLFELQKKQNSTQSTCSVKTTGKWTALSQKESADGSTVFNNLPNGKYRIICLSAQAIGCKIKGTNDRSIVFAKEVSKVIDLGQTATSNKTDTAVNTFSNKELTVFPNPAKDKINIQLKSNALNGDIQIILYDMLGKQIKSVSKNYQQAALQTWEMGIHNCSSGTYLIRLSDAYGNALHQKVVIENQE